MIVNFHRRRRMSRYDRERKAGTLTINVVVAEATSSLPQTRLLMARALGRGFPRLDIRGSEIAGKE